MKPMKTKTIYSTKERRFKIAIRKFYAIMASIIIASGFIVWNSMALKNEIGDNQVFPGVKAQETKNKGEESLKEKSIQEWLWNELDNYDFTMQEKMNTILLIGSCENKNWDIEARYINKNAKSVDRGLFMINDVYHKEVSNSCSYDKDCALKEFVRIYREKGLKEWTCGRTLGLR